VASQGYERNVPEHHRAAATKVTALVEGGMG